MNSQLNNPLLFVNLFGPDATDAKMSETPGPGLDMLCCRAMFSREERPCCMSGDFRWHMALFL